MITSQQFQTIAKAIFEETGICYHESEAYRLEKRLRNLMEKFEFQSIEQLIPELEKKRVSQVFNYLIDLSTNNETSFFRDMKPFDYFKNIIMPSLKNRNRINVWSAACSSGQEPYSLAMSIHTHFPMHAANHKVSIWATDISSAILKKAKSGIYTDLDVSRGLDENLKNKYFANIDKNAWQINESIRSVVDFAHFNLLTGTYPINKFDVIFCRNVLIYQSLENKERILNKLSSSLTKDGFLILGAGESYIGRKVALEQKNEMGLAVFSKKYLDEAS